MLETGWRREAMGECSRNRRKFLSVGLFGGKKCVNVGES